MTRPLRLLAIPALLLLSVRSFAWAEPDCAVVAWSDAHGHYHCVDEGRYAPAGYHAPRAVSAPRIYVDLSLNRYPGAWRRHGNHWGWYRPAHFYAAPRHYHSRYCHHRY